MRQTTDLPRLAKRAVSSHKGNFGRALLVGGSQGMCGAIALAGRATLRSGAGLVTVATPECCCDVVASFEASYMTLPLATDDGGRVTRDAVMQVLTQPADVVACGPGLGQDHKVIGLASTLFVQLAKPMVMDADGLNALAVSDDVWGHHPAPRILTPHPGEFRRLVGRSDLDEKSCHDLADDWARERNVVLVLKGHKTLVTDGQQQALNSTGNPGMATGGCGDVLTGVITALLCQGLEPFQAAQLGVFVHGRAGDLAAAALGQVSLIASDLIDYLPKAFQSLDEA